MNFGNIKTPEECAAIAFNNDCHYFMFAEKHTEWGCICCHDYKTAKGKHNDDGWNIYSVK